MMSVLAGRAVGLRFHWGLPTREVLPGDGVLPVPSGTPPRAVPDLASQVDFCQLAERCGIDSVLIAIGYYLPDPLVLATALAGCTQVLRFIVAHRAGLITPPMFVQQVNTLSALSRGRIALNMVIGHSPEEQRSYGDFLGHDERYERVDAYLAACHALWRRSGKVDIDNRYYRLDGGWVDTPFVAADRAAPEIYFGGGSAMAPGVAARRADCWMRLGATTPASVAADAAAIRAQDTQLGLRFHLMIRSTHEEAVRAVRAVVAERGDRSRFTRVFLRGTDSPTTETLFAGADDDADQWPAPWLWTGAVPTLGPSAVYLVGTPEEIAGALGEYRRVGVSQFIFSGWPDRETMRIFGEQVVPLVRTDERIHASA
jgi:alkanesulfonate monooxygenase